MSDDKVKKKGPLLKSGKMFVVDGTPGYTCVGFETRNGIPYPVVELSNGGPRKIGIRKGDEIEWEDMA